MFFRIILIMLFASLLVVLVKKEGKAGERGWTDPWQEESFSAKEKARYEGKMSSAGQRISKGFIRFFQIYISPVDGDRCPSYPTCSQYALQAMRKHGAIMGLIMGFGRLIHESDEIHLAPPIRVGDSYRYYDPVEKNDFWWKK